MFRLFYFPLLILLCPALDQRSLTLLLFLPNDSSQ